MSTDTTLSTESSEGFNTRAGAPVWLETMSMDFDAALAFYRDVLSWDIVWTGPEGGSPEFRYVTHGVAEAAAAGLCDAAPFFPAETPSFWRIYFAVEDADAAVSRVEELGGELISEAVSDSPFGRFATVADPTGASFLINQAPTAPGLERGKLLSSLEPRGQKRPVSRRRSGRPSGSSTAR